jgi:hypothetical protein
MGFDELERPVQLVKTPETRHWAHSGLSARRAAVRGCAAVGAAPISRSAAGIRGGRLLIDVDPQIVAIANPRQPVSEPGPTSSHPQAR